MRDWSRYALAVFWGGDTLIDKVPWLYREARRFTELCQSRGIPVVNPATRWQNVAKSRSSAIVAAAGLRTPRIERVHDVQQFVAIVPACRCRSSFARTVATAASFAAGSQARRARTHPVGRFRNPIAAEFIETCAVGQPLYCKYRYVAVGGTGIAHI